MAFEWQGVRFVGTYRQLADLQARPGVYMILCDRGDGWSVLDVGEASDVRARVLGHDRKGCWQGHCGGELLYAAHYTHWGEAGRREIETRLRSAARPPCGSE